VADDRVVDAWQPTSWQSRPTVQQPNYPDAQALAAAVDTLRALPPLVTSWEVNALKAQLAAAQTGRCFVLQGGDCAESFDDCRADIITNRLKVMLQMSLVLVHGRRQQVLRIGRVAGQYAKPRSADVEVRDGVTLPSYRGDLINAPAFTAAARTPDPRRLLEGYSRAALTLNFTRGLIDGGFADLHHPEYWNLPWVAHSPLAESYQRRVDNIAESLQFMETLAGSIAQFGRIDFYSSHEALLLWYEQAQTRRVPRRDGWYNLATHLPWIGMRSADPGGGHVEYCRGIRNPVGVKVGPAMTVEWLLDLCRCLDPGQEPGRLVLIHRMGAARIATDLPPLLDALRRAGRRALWLCDPMHGNTRSTANGLKTRRFEDIADEIELAAAIHRDAGGHLGGVHLELTGEDVTECTGGARALTEVDLERAFRSTVDPRLNYEQSLELALMMAALPASTPR